MWSIITACVRVPVRPQSSSAVAGKCDGKLLPAPSSCPPGGQSGNHRACPHLPWTGRDTAADDLILGG